MSRHRLPGVVAAVSLALAALTGWFAWTADQWNGPCRPRFPDSDTLTEALPVSTCFTVDGSDVAGYVVHLRYSDLQHAPEDNLRLAYQEAGVFWQKFPYPVYGFDIDSGAAFGESAIGRLYLSDDVLQVKLGSRPESLKLLGAFPEQPMAATQFALWGVSGTAAVISLVTGGLAARRTQRSRGTTE